MKTNKSLNRILSILLVLCMVVQFIPLPHVHATEADPNTDTVTIYFNNTNNWEQVLAYYWSDTNNGMTDWPGVTMTGIGDGIWSIAVPADATMIIFNDSVGSQTGDLTIPTDGENQYNYDSNAWTVYGAVDESCAHTGGTQTCKGYACDTCGSWYGEPDPNAHSTTAEGDRAATCVNLAYCSACGEEYGSLNTSNHETPDTYSYEDLGNGKHSTLYACCKADTGLLGRFHSYDPATKECVCGALQPPTVHWIIKSPDGSKDESFDALVEVGNYYHPPTGVSFDGYDLAGWFTEPDGKGTPFTGGYMDNTGDKTYYAYFTDPVLDANMISVVTNADDPDILTRFIVAPGDSLESVAATLTALVNNPSYGITKANHTFAGITFYTDTTCTTLYTGTTVYGACAAMNWTCDTLTKQDEEPATCAQTGISEYWSCSCGKNYSDAQGMEEIPDLDAWKEGDGRTPVRDDAHTPDETTGQTCKGYWCTTCESWYGEVDADAHTPDETTGQTCKGYWCTTCESWYGEADADAHTFDSATGMCQFCHIPAEATVTNCETVTYYANLDSAINNADGGILTVLQAVRTGISIVDGSFTLDLNGHVITLSSPSVQPFQFYGVVTITDSSQAKTGGITGEDRYALFVGGTVTITGGRFQGDGTDISVFSDDCTLLLTLADGAVEGPIFPGGISVSGTTLAEILDEGLAYWQNGKQVTLTEGQTEISGGDVVVRKACDHSGNTNEDYTDNGDGTHSFTCSVCSTTAAKPHSLALDYVNLEAEGHKAYYPCCQKEEDVEAVPHTYESGICACLDAQQYTAAFMGYSEGLVITNPTPEHGKDYVTQLTGSAPHIEFVWINCGTTQNVPYTFDEQTRTLTIAGAYVDGNITIAARPYVVITIEPNGGEHDGSSAAFTVTANYKQTLYGVDISRNGYWLDGWNTKADGTGDGYTVDSFLATEDITLYAQWACAHTLGEVKFHDNGNGTHNGYCGNCGEALGNYEERPHNYDENTHKCACGAPETFTVTVNDGNDSIVVSLSSDTATFGEDFVAELSSDAATAPHYEIRYYDVGEDRYTDFTYENGKLTIPAANITGNLEIHIRPYVTMTFHGNGGVFQDPPTGEEDETLVRQWDYGENRRLFTERDEVRAGYGFTGFNTKADGTGTAYNASEWHIHTEDLVLYAQWEANTYSYMVETYTMDAYGRYSLTAEEEKSALYGTAVNATPADVDEGFYLDEEHTDSLLTATIPANDDLVLKVYIGRNQYAITWDLNGGTAENLEYLPKQELYDVTITIPTQIWKEGHTLSHFVDQTGKQYEIRRSSMEDIMDMYLVAMPAYDATFTAVWTVNAYTLHAQGQSLDVDYGTALADALSGIAPEKTGYTFTGWKFYLDEGCEEEYTGTTMPAYEIYAQPQFEAIQYNITWDMSGCTYELSYSNELPTKLEYCVDAWIPFHQVSFFEITPPEGYTFVGFVDGNGNELEMSNSDIYRLYLTVSGDMTVKAVIEPKTYMATWETGDGGSYEKEFKFGEVITIPETEIFQDTFRKSGYTLTGWEGYTEGMTMPVDGVTFTAKWQINQANLAVSSGKYTGKAHAPTVTVEGLTEGEDFTVTYPADMTNVGEKTITVTGKLGGTVTVTYTIEKADAPVITFPEVLNAITYGQELGDAKLSFYENEYGSFNWAAPIGTPNAGTGDYALDFYPSDLNNYDWANYSGAQWIESRNALCAMGRVIVNKAPVTHSGTDLEVAYDGTAIDLRTMFRLDPNAGEAFWWIISEDGDGSFDENPWNYKIHKIGTFTVEVRTEATDNYAAGSATAKLTVRKGTITASVTLEGWTYGETAKTPVAEAQTNGAVTYLYTGENYSSDMAPTNAGTYTVIATFAETDLYKATTASTSFTIAKKVVTVTADAQTKTYGSDDPVLTYTVNGLVNGDKLTGELERRAGENAGSYAIEQGSLTAGDNYAITYTGAELTIKPKAIGANDVALNGSLTYNGSEQTQNVAVAEGITFTVTDNKATNAGTYELTVTGTGNYTGEVKLSWSIQKAVAVVGTAPAANALTYTGEIQALVTAGTTADGRLVYSLAENGAYTETIPTGTNAGDYTVWYYVKGDSNHTDSAKSSVAVKIGKAEQTITLAEPVTEAKCSTTVKLPQVTAQGAIAFESSDPTVAKITADGITAVTAGTVTITVTAAETDNYKKAEKTYTLTIDHDPASTWESDGEYHWHSCVCGYKADYKAHTPSAADICTEDQLCTVCERVLQEKTGHSHVPTVTPPTCTEQGYTTYTCHCGDSYTTDKVAALGHNYTNEWDTQCNNCGAIRIIESVPMYRLYNPNTGEHFYTGSTVERDNLVEVGWKYEGVAWNAPVEYGDPVYRVYNPVSGDHHFTMSWKEVEDLQEAGWNYEGVAWNSASSDHLPIYRLYNPNADLGAHHFTGSAEERDNLVAIGWKYEGIGWYALLY